MSPGRYSPSANGIPSTGSGSPVSSAYSPHGSTQPIPPPSGFASSAGVPLPVSLSPKLHPSQNGGIAYQQPHLRVGFTDAQVRRQEVQFVPHGSPNSNGNNNTHRNRFTDHTISLGMVNQVMGPAEMELERQTPPPLQKQYFPSEVSNLSHPETRSSMESGFDADTEPDHQQNPWYNISPNASPKSRRDNHPILGPQVTVPSGHMNPHHIRTSSESRDSHHSGSQMSQHDSASDDYERLMFKQPHPQSGRSSTLAEQRRGSLDAVVMLSAKEKSNTFTYGEYDQAYPPSHKPSHSFDVTAPVGVRGYVRRTSPSSHHSQESHHSTRPPVPQSSRASSGRSRSEKRPHHVRNHSQPEHLAHAVAPYPHNSTNSHSQPDSRSPSRTHSRRTSTKSNDSVFQSAYPGHRGGEGKGSSSHDQSNQIHNPRTQNMHKTGRGRFYSDIHSKIVENELYQHNHPRHRSERLMSYPNYASDDSRQSTPVATPTLATRVCRC